MPQTQALSYEIEPSVDIETSILSYFDFSVKAITEFQAYLYRYRELDFIRMRRFLNTTYRTLTEIDSQFMAQKLSAIYDKLNNMAAVYDAFMQKNDYGRRSFEKIFLRVQKNFDVLEKKFEVTKAKIAELELHIDTLEDKHRRYERRLAQSKAGSEDQESHLKSLQLVASELQKVKKNKQILHNDNMLVDRALVQFLRSYKAPFAQTHEAMVSNIENNLIRILNVMAFELDIELWHKAKQSRVIQERFKEFMRGKVVSSKVYLEYYLKNLDPRQMNPEQKEQRLVLEYLNTINPISVLILIPDIVLVEQFKLAIQSDNSGFEVSTYVDVKVALTSALTKNIDLFMIDVDIGDSLVESFLQTYKKNVNQGKRKKAKLMLITDIVDGKSLQHAEALGADSMIERDVEAVEIIDSVYTLIKM
jgi:hypothetical protein